MSEPPPKRPTNAAIAQAILEWQAPAALSGAELMPNAAHLGRSPILEAGFVDPTKTGAFVKSLRASDPLRQSVLPNVLASSLVTQVGRPLATQVGSSLTVSQIGLEHGALVSLAGIGKNLAVIHEALMRPASAVQALVEKLKASFVDNWQPQFERFGQAVQQLAEEGRLHSAPFAWMRVSAERRRRFLVWTNSEHAVLQPTRARLRRAKRSACLTAPQTRSSSEAGICGEPLERLALLVRGGVTRFKSSREVAEAKAVSYPSSPRYLGRITSALRRPGPGSCLSL